MARVSARPETGRLESTLTYLEREWTAVPDLAARWSELDEFDRQDLWREWGIRDEALREVADARDAGELSPAQCSRLEQLLAVVAENTLIIERLFAA